MRCRKAGVGCSCLANGRTLPQAGGVIHGWALLQIPRTKGGLALCRCECGTVKPVKLENILRGLSRRCKSCSSRITKTKHGASDCGRTKAEDRLYRIWKAMKWRCSPKNERARNYHGRGIRVCREWSRGYPAFRDWALRSGYREHLTIDREDNDLGYSPRNCRWVGYGPQARNTRRNRRVTAFGETKLVCEWLEDRRCKVGGSALAMRLRRGWTEEDAISTPPLASKTDPNRPSPASSPPRGRPHACRCGRRSG